MTQPTYAAGQHVEFTAKGRTYTGTIIRVRLKQRRGRVRDLAEQVTGDAGSLDRMVAEIAQDDSANNVVWTVGYGLIKKVLGKGDYGKALATKQALKNARSERAYDKFKKGLDVLPTARPGDTIEVQFRGGYWRKVQFNGFVRGSGKIRFIDGGRNRTTHPQFVREVATPAAPTTSNPAKGITMPKAKTTTTPAPAAATTTDAAAKKAAAAAKRKAAAAKKKADAAAKKAAEAADAAAKKAAPASGLSKGDQDALDTVHGLGAISEATAKDREEVWAKLTVGKKANCGNVRKAGLIEWVAYEDGTKGLFVTKAGLKKVTK